VELGVTFQADYDGYITGIRFFKSAGNTGTHASNLWSDAGALLATATFSGESATGWQQVNFSKPLAITANTVYVASYHANAGHYSITEDFFTTSGVDRGPLHALANGSGVTNGPYAYGNTSIFPTQNYKSTNYWVDVVFSQALTAAPVAPAITTQPAGQTVVAGQPATFAVAATGTAPMSYQWKKNGTNISGATSSSYTTPATTSADSDTQFSVVISNSAGSVTSNNATMAVSATTRLLSATPTTLSFGKIDIGTSGLLTTILTNTGDSNVSISNVSMAGAGFNANGVSAGQILVPGQTAALNVTFLPALTGGVAGSAVVTSSASNSPTTISLSGTGVQLVSHSAFLSWTGSTSTVAGYYVYSGSVSGGPYTKLTTTPIAATTYIDSNIQSGTRYYVVTAIDASSVESLYSSEVSAVIP
jgi:hypothetical protein